MIAAHRDVLRTAHRLLLILVPQDSARSTPLAAQLEAEEGWHVANRARDEEAAKSPDEDRLYDYVVPTKSGGSWAPLAIVAGLVDSVAQHPRMDVILHGDEALLREAEPVDFSARLAQLLTTLFP